MHQSNVTEANITQLYEAHNFKGAFNALVETQQEQLLRVILRIVGDHDEALDLLQDTFIKIWQNLEKFEGKSKWSTWTYRIASNEALMYLRKKKKWMTTSDPLVTEQLEASSFFDGDEAMVALYRALDTLPAKQRLVFQMRYFDELPYSEIAEITSTSEGALKASYHHAVKKIESEVIRFKQFEDLSIKEAS
ncbi:RNA polymerase sigma factor [Phaeocystidibacter marisrubri]|uniref:RNA polymerase sigma factor n=1 Tax=Phaeocystidibacter marisrubri TaxID=1577780 RepID=UPI0019A60073|nr:sigma-70 family RNA polymerase sigma factor [Phaeocystidibacter marisrubri]GGH76009.1 DNA-directed RNA polymerase sigma-70 factor [Phaeocystidibacter marisrubri]